MVGKSSGGEPISAKPVIVITIASKIVNTEPMVLFKNEESRPAENTITPVVVIVTYVICADVNA